jgi:hypothetical protein
MHENGFYKSYGFSPTLCRTPLQFHTELKSQLLADCTPGDCLDHFISTEDAHVFSKFHQTKFLHRNVQSCDVKQYGVNSSGGRCTP